MIWNRQNHLTAENPDNTRRGQKIAILICGIRGIRGSLLSFRPEVAENAVVIRAAYAYAVGRVGRLAQWLARLVYTE